MKLNPYCVENVFGFDFWAGGSDAAESLIREWLKSPDYFNISFANPEFLLNAEKNRELADYLRRCSAIFADGIGILWASHLQNGLIQERITGTDFQWRIFKIAEELNLGVFLYGSRSDVANIAVQKICERFPSLRIGSCNGYVSYEEALKHIVEFNPDILIVCLGNPLQEEWISRYGEKTGARLVFGNGGALDFISGRMKRAPDWMLKYNLEWLWRLGQDLTWTRLQRQARLTRYLVKLAKLKYHLR